MDVHIPERFRAVKVVLIGWKLPPDGWVKLNTDGSCRDDGSIGCGGVIKGSAGEWLGGFSKFIGNINAYVAELWGVLEGLKIARRLNFRALELHVDSVVVVQAISGNGHGSHRGSAAHVQKIRKL
ncbi:ribonuclease H protein [Trifolium medium]|uniref:Ribonuclease H protein n=1 Tax=Trifolium medium TaxID=97028 RepID=A0A392P2U1_9FABA|nr:ribonuclease H protein [Trifolium medium]